MLIVEDVMLLLLDDASGFATGTSTWTMPQMLGGAVLVELALAEHVSIDDSRSPKHAALVHPVLGATPPRDPLLQQALGVVTQHVQEAPDLVTRLGTRLQESVADRLVDRGIVRREQPRSVLGAQPAARWPAQDVRHEQELRGTLELVLVRGAEPDARTGAIIDVLSAAGQAHRVLRFPDVAPRDVRARAAIIAQGSWIAAAVDDAIRATQGGIMGTLLTGNKD